MPILSLWGRIVLVTRYDVSVILNPVLVRTDSSGTDSSFHNIRNFGIFKIPSLQGWIVPMKVDNHICIITPVPTWTDNLFVFMLEFISRKGFSMIQMECC